MKNLLEPPFGKIRKNDFQPKTEIIHPDQHSKLFRLDFLFILHFRISFLDPPLNVTHISQIFLQHLTKFQK
jgi:hypothetical protein